MRENIEAGTCTYLDKILTSFFIQLLIKDVHVQAVYLGGSYAREEARSYSDIDLYILFKEEVTTSYLKKLGEITELLRNENPNLEINAQCLSEKEFLNPAFSNFLSKPILYFEAIKLYGDFIIPIPSKAETSTLSRSLLAESLLSVRHYISVKEKPEKLTKKKIKQFILKPTIASLKLRQFLLEKDYPLTTKALHQAIEPSYKKLVVWHQSNKCLEESLKEDSQHFLTECHDFLVNLLAEEY